MSILEKSSNKTVVISSAEIKELDDYLTSLLNNLDEKVAKLELLSPPRSNNCSSQEIASDPDCSNTIEYLAVQDTCDPDITNVMAYIETETTEVSEKMDECFKQHCLRYVEEESNANNNENFYDDKSLLDDISSINSSVSLFSPVEPNKLSNQSVVSNETTNNSINSISSIDTIRRPSLNEIPQTIDDVLDGAFCKLDGTPFHLFNVNHLDESTSGYLKLGTRSAAYYGKYPYTYSGISHPARPFSDNKYLMHILSYVEIVLPEFRFNSAMVHRYYDGNCTMPQHSDNEACIESDSDIVTISFGDTRSMEFKSKHSGDLDHVLLSHGEVLIMSRTSQEDFTHAIPLATNKSTRLSVTLRLIKPVSQNPQVESSHNFSNTQSTVTNFLDNLSSVLPRRNENSDDVQEEENDVHRREDQPFYEPHDGYQDMPHQSPPSVQRKIYPPIYPQNVFQNPRSTPLEPSKPVKHYERQRSQYSWHREGWQPPQRSVQPRELQNNQFPPDQIHPSRRNSHPRNDQFKAFQENKSDDVVFISSSMFADLDAYKLSSGNIKSHVFFYRGANSQRMMDKLKNDQEIQNLAMKRTVSKVFLLTGTNNVDDVCCERQNMQEACSSISRTIRYVQSLFSTAEVNLISILPRIAQNRKMVIRKLNEHIESICKNNLNNKLKYIDTYSIRLFTFPNGTRKSELFKYTFRNDIDNVHLNNYGVIKLGRHLKYLAHR